MEYSGSPSKVVCGIPFRGAYGPREEILRCLLPHIKRNYEFADLILADSQHEPFNRAATRNLLVKLALEKGADVVVINDADSLADPTVLDLAIRSAYSDGRLHLPFDRVNIRGHSWFGRNPAVPRQSRIIHTYGPSCGGIYVIRPERWVHLGGMDERIVGWGFEDEILIVTSRRFIGGYTSHPGPLETWTHERTRETADIVGGNMSLRNQYVDHENDAEYIAALQIGSNQWCTQDRLQSLFPQETVHTQ